MKNLILSLLLAGCSYSQSWKQIYLSENNNRMPSCFAPSPLFNDTQYFCMRTVRHWGKHLSSDKDHSWWFRRRVHIWESDK